MEKKKLYTYAKTLGVMLFVFFIISVYPIAYTMSSDTEIVFVSKTDRVSYGSGSDLSHKYLVYTKDGETFEIVDSFVFLTFRSSDIYGKITSGKKYKCKVAGWRIPFLSSYRNILSAEEIQTK